MGKLDNKVALVTGGSKGLGKGIVETFLREGAKVAFCGRNEERLQAALAEFKKISPNVIAIQCDLIDSADVKRMFAKIVEEFGTLDILVNNAGKPRSAGEYRAKHYDLVTKPGPKTPLDITRYMTDEEWDGSIKGNLYPVFYCTREALNIMEPKHYGKIVNVASTAGINKDSPHSPNYSAAKGAIVAFTRTVQYEVSGSGVIINCIAPGFIETPGLLKLLETEPRILQSIPQYRVGTIEEHAALALFLASDDCNFICGQTISANGGVS